MSYSFCFGPSGSGKSYLLRQMIIQEADRSLAALIPENIQTGISSEVTDYSQILVTIREGKFHQIKRMFASRQKEVLYLKRLSMGPLYLDPFLLPGQFRPLTREEIDSIGGHPDARFFHSP